MDYQKMIFKTRIDIPLCQTPIYIIVKHTCIDDDIEIQSVTHHVPTEGGAIKEHINPIPQSGWEQIKEDYYYLLLESAADQIQKMREWEDRYNGQIQEAV